MPGLTYTLKADSRGIEKGMQTARQAVEKFRADVQRPMQVGGPKGIFGDVLGGNLAAEGIKRLGGAMADAAGKAGQLVDAEDQIGITAEELSRLEKVFMGSGVSVETLRKSMLNLVQAQAAVRGGSDDAAKKFAELGITTSEVINSNTLDLFFKLSDGVRELGAGTQQTAATMDILGVKNAKLVGGMKAGSEEIKSAMKEVSGVIEQDNAKALDNLTDKIEEVGTAAKDGLINRVGAFLSGASKGWQAYKSDVEAAKKATDEIAEKIDASKAPKDLAEAKKASDAEKKAAWERRKNALDEIASKKAAIEDEEIRTEASERETKAYQKQREKLEETLSLDQRMAFARERVRKAQDEKNKAREGTAQMQVAEADLAEAQSGLQDVQEEQIQRIMGGSTSAAAAQRAERREQRARARAERILQKRQDIRDMDAKARGEWAKPAEMNLQGPQKKDPEPEKQTKLLDNIEKELTKLNQRLTVA